MGQVTTLVEPHPKDGVPGLQKREIDPHVRLCAGVRLNIGELGAEQFFGAVDRKLFHLIYDLTPLVVATPGVALRVFVGEDRTRGCHHRWRGKVLGCDEVNIRILALEVFANEARDCRIDLLN